MTDLSQTIAPKSDQINADDLIAGPRTITISRVTADPASPEQPVAIFFEGDNGKPYKPCKSMRRVMVTAWGADGSQYPGRSMTLYRDPSVQFGGMQVGGIRISHMSHIDRDLTMALTVTKARRAGFTVKRMAAPPTTAAVDTAAQAEAREVATRGTAAFRNWWGANPDKREACKSILPELQSAAMTADETLDEFGLPPADERPATATDDEVQRQALTFDVQRGNIDSKGGDA